MPSLLLVGELSGTAAATLADRGFELRSVGDGDASLEGDGGRRAVGTGGLGERSGQGPEAGGAAELDPAVGDVDCAVVRAGADDVAAIEQLDDVESELPVLYAVESSNAGAAGPALTAGADDRVLLTGERDGQRLAARVQHLLGTGTGSDGSTPDLEAQPAGHSEDAHDDRIATLLEGAQDFLRATSPTAVAETAVATAERALGYDLVSVRTVTDDGETLESAAISDDARDTLTSVEPVTVAGSVFEPALVEQRTQELDDEALTAGGYEELSSTLLFPIGKHAVLALGSAEPDAFGQSDRHVGELLAANARGALDRVDRVERIESIHTATREMLDASDPEGVARRAVEATRSILEYQFVVCFLEGDDGGLEPVAWTDAADALTDGAIPAPAEGDGALEAFESGAVVRRDGGEGTAAAAWPTTSRLHVPIEDQGSLLVASPGDRSFEESDVQLARLLATNTARTLDRVRRTQELERYETVFETVNDMVYVQDEDGVLLHCTPVLADRLGYDREELIGEPVGALVDPADEAEGRRIIEALLDDPPGATRTQRLELITADGEEVPVEVDMSLLPGDPFRGVVGTVRDISDLLDVRERLDSQQDRFEYLFENIPDPVVEGHIEDDAVVGSVNAAFEETFGYDESEIVGETVNDVIVPDEKLEEARALDRRSAAGEVNYAQVERETQYGRREFLFRGVPYNAADGEMRGFGIYTDITDQKERERHLEVLQRLLRHNVRNEVNVLLASIDQLRAAREDGGDRENDDREGSDDREAELLETLDETARDLLTMSQKAKRIRRVLEYETEELGEIDVAGVTRSVVEQFQRLDEDATIELDAPEHCPVLGTGAIERAIEELVGNALQHAGPAPTVSVVLERTDDGAELTVADDGPGIPAAERRVLDRGEITPLQHGSGLGLWLVSHATAASGGTVTFDEGSSGASVTLSFRSVGDDD